MGLNNTVRQPVTGDYQAIFREYIVKSTGYVLDTVRQYGNILPDYDRDLALHTLKYALKLPEAWTNASDMLLTLSPQMERGGYRDEWMPYLEKGIEQSRQLNDMETEAGLHLQLGILYRLCARYKDAHSHLETSVNEFKSSGTVIGQAQALNHLAHVARLQCNLKEAVNLVEEALNLLDGQVDEQAYSYLVLGLVSLDRLDWQATADFCSKSLALWELVDNRWMMGRTLTILGVAVEKMGGRNEEAITICKRAIALFAEVQDSAYQAVAQMNLGNVYLALNRYSEALDCYFPARQIFRQINDKHHLAMVNHNIGMSCRNLKQWSKSEKAYLMSIKQRQELGNIGMFVNSMDGLGLLYLAEEKAEKAMAVYEEALGWLAQIEDDPGYDFLFNMITEHLKQTVTEVQ